MKKQNKVYRVVRKKQKPMQLAALLAGVWNGFKALGVALIVMALIAWLTR